MIFELIFAMLANLLIGLVSLVTPALPNDFYTVFNYGLVQLQRAMGFVWLFVDRAYLSQLAMWWLGLASLVFTVELAMEIWRGITGNFGGQDVTAEITYEHNDDGSYTRHTKTKTRRRLPRL